MREFSGSSSTGIERNSRGQEAHNLSDGVVDLKYDRWRGSIARKDEAGNFGNIKVKPAHRYAKSIYQKVRGQKISYDYLNPGYKGMKSNLKINEAQEITSVNANETIYNDFGRVEGRNSISCEF